MSSVKFNSIPSKTLADSISASSSSFRLNNITGWDGTDLTAADFGETGYGVFRNATNTQIEFFEFDPSTIADSTITITRRGLYHNAVDLTTEVAGNKLTWTKGDTFVDLGTDTPQMLQWLKEYIDAASIAGAVPMTDVVQGIAKLSVAAAVAANPIVVGDNDPRLPSTDEKAALAGGGSFGTPSAGNKYLTQNYIPSIGPLLTTGVTKKILIDPSTTEIANNTTTETNIFSTTITGGLLGSANAIRFKVLLSNLSVSSNASEAPVLRLKYGSTTVATITLANGDETQLGGYIEGLLIANAATDAQAGVLHLSAKESGVDPDKSDTSADYIETIATGSATEDSTGDLTLSLTIQWAVADNANDIVPAVTIVELIS